MEPLDLKTIVAKIVKILDSDKFKKYRSNVKFKEFGVKVKALYTSIDKRLEDRPSLSEVLFNINEIILYYNRNYSYYYNININIRIYICELREYAQAKLNQAANNSYVFPMIAGEPTT